MNKLRNKVAVITGGNSGIGYGIGEAFSKEGAIGAITGRNKDTLNKALKSLNSGFIALSGDINRDEELEHIFKTTSDKFEEIDILVVNAGGVVDGVPMESITDITEDHFDRYMDLNLKSAYFTVKESLPYLKDCASIILIGSSAAHRAAPGMTVYGAAKAAVISMAKGLSLDLLYRNIRVNVLSPGTIKTPAFDKMIPVESLDEVLQTWVDLIPVGRPGYPSDIGNAAVFLASED